MTFSWRIFKWWLWTTYFLNLPVRFMVCKTLYWNEQITIWCKYFLKNHLFQVKMDLSPSKLSQALEAWWYQVSLLLCYSACFCASKHLLSLKQVFSKLQNIFFSFSMIIREKIDGKKYRFDTDHRPWKCWCSFSYLFENAKLAMTELVFSFPLLQKWRKFMRSLRIVI